MKILNKILDITLAVLISISFTFESVHAEETDVSNDKILKDQNLYNEEIEDINEMGKYEKYINQNDLGHKYPNDSLMLKYKFSLKKRMLNNAQYNIRSMYIFNISNRFYICSEN